MHCFAPGCRTGYPNGPKASLFAAPKNANLRKKWERNLDRKDKAFSISSAVCERHFELHFILRDYVHVINGNEVRTPRGKPSLAPEAVPKVLPGCPSYLSTATPRQKPERKKRALPSNESQQKKACLQNQSFSDEDDGGAPLGEDLPAADRVSLSLYYLRTMEPSSQDWCHIELQSLETAVFDISPNEQKTRDVARKSCVFHSARKRTYCKGSGGAEC